MLILKYNAILGNVGLLPYGPLGPGKQAIYWLTDILNSISDFKLPRQKITQNRRQRRSVYV